MSEISAFSALSAVRSGSREYASNGSDPIGGVDAFYEIGQIAGVVLGQVLFVVGLLGLRAGYAARSGSLGAGLLLIAVVGGAVSLGGMLIMSSTEFGWNIWMLGMLTMTLTLAVFGAVAMQRKVFSRWNFAPLMAGVGMPVLLFAGLILDPGDGVAPEWAAFLAVGLTSVGLVLVGYRMQAESERIGAA